MIRKPILASIVLSLFAASTLAEDHPRFTVTSEARRSGDDITVSMKIVENSTEVVPGIGRTPVTTARSTPRITLRDGQQAQLAIGRPGPAPRGAPAATEPGDIYSGIKVDIISVKARDNVLIVTTILEDGSTVWAEAATVKVQIKPPNGQK